MKHLIIYSHPNPQSFNQAILQTFKTQLEQRQDEVRVRDLYALSFNPVLAAEDFLSLQKGKVPPDIKTEQDHVRWAEVITFIFPIWWTGLPAMLKGYIDRVFSHGFAYSYGKEGPRGLLGDKRVFIINTTGSPREAYERSGMFQSLRQTIEEGIFMFCGMTVVGHKYFSGVVSCSRETRQAMLEEVKAVAREGF